MSRSAALTHHPVALVQWPGERVETTALFMPATAQDDAPLSAIESVFVPKPASHPVVTAQELWSALLAVCVLTAGAAAVTPVVALLLFR